MISVNLIVLLNLYFIFSLPQIYEEFYHNINHADHNKDLKWWSNNYGCNMGMAWPAFVVSTFQHTFCFGCQQYNLSFSKFGMFFHFLIFNFFLCM